MASTEKKVRDGKTTWQARWRDPDGKQCKKSNFRVKPDAEKFLAKIETSKADGTYVDPSAGKTTVGEYAPTWLAGQVHLKPSTRARYEGLLRARVLKKWESVPLSAVTHSGVGEWVQQLAKSGAAPSTVRQAHRVLSLILDLAVRDGRLARNPAVKVKLPAARRAEAHFLTIEEVERLADACPEPYGVLVRFLAFSGLRFGEVAALRVKRLDLARRRVRVVESVTEVGGKAEFTTPKTGRGRSVPFPAFLVDDLAELVAGCGPEEFVFTAPDGGLLRHGNWRRRVFNRAAKDAGLVGITPHDLRSTAASLAISAGANVKAVQTMLGHASGAMTIDVYAGLFGDDLDAVAEQLDRAHSKIVPAGCPTAKITDLADRRTGR